MLSHTKRENGFTMRVLSFLVALSVVLSARMRDEKIRVISVLLAVLLCIPFVGFAVVDIKS
jgi:hypothetical protein